MTEKEKRTKYLLGIIFDLQEENERLEKLLDERLETLEDNMALMERGILGCLKENERLKKRLEEAEAVINQGVRVMPFQFLPQWTSVQAWLGEKGFKIGGD